MASQNSRLAKVVRNLVVFGRPSDDDLAELDDLAGNDEPVAHRPTPDTAQDAADGPGDDTGDDDTTETPAGRQTGTQARKGKA